MRLLTSSATALLGLVLLAAPGQAEESPLVLVERVMEAPPATGLVVTTVAPESPASVAGIEPGDVIVAYGGRTTDTVEALAAAKAMAEQNRLEVVALDLVRESGNESEVAIAPGELGIGILPVRKGTSALALPPPTEIVFAIDRLRDAPVDDWFGFWLTSGPKLGFEHLQLSVAGDELRLRREVAFDGGRRWSLNHFDVGIVASAAHPLQVRSVTFVAPLENYRSRGVPATGPGGAPVWRLGWTGRDEESGAEESGREEVFLPPGLPVVPSYYVLGLASLMPKEEGACFHFRPLAESNGRPELRGALVVVEKESISLGDVAREAWRVEQRRAGGRVIARYWVQEDGRTLKVDYCGPTARLSTQADATSLIHPEIEPRSAR